MVTVRTRFATGFGTFVSLAAAARGKTTIARRLAARHRTRLYETEIVSRYVEGTTAEEAPMLHAFIAMDMDERWVNRPPAVMRDTFRLPRRGFSPCR